ncbi:MAG TPA: PIN domain-containing protein [Terracidiphilus sp.]|nr:PIN domain-containing protein [Terracidiphilus sp.]
MGLIVDSTLFIAAERKGLRATQALGEIATRFPEETIAVSVITLAELAHGAARAIDPARELFRRHFIHEIRTNIPVVQVTAETAIRAGEMDGIFRSQGLTIGFSDLLIGATALELNYRVATANLRHFHLIQGLTVIQY